MTCILEDAKSDSGSQRRNILERCSTQSVWPNSGPFYQNAVPYSWISERYSDYVDAKTNW